MDSRQIRDKIDRFSDAYIRFLIDQFVHSERDRAILKRKLLDDITFERLAEEFDLSVRRAKTIVYNGQLKIYKHIPE